MSQRYTPLVVIFLPPVPNPANPDIMIVAHRKTRMRTNPGERSLSWISSASLFPPFCSLLTFLYFPSSSPSLPCPARIHLVRRRPWHVQRDHIPGALHRAAPIIRKHKETDPPQTGREKKNSILILNTSSATHHGYLSYIHNINK